MERRFRNLQSPKYLGNDKRFKAWEQEGVFAQRKRQGFDVAVNPPSGQSGCLEGCGAVFSREPTSAFPPRRLPWFLRHGQTYRDSHEWKWECRTDTRTQTFSTSSCYRCLQALLMQKLFAVRCFLRVSTPVGKKNIVRFGMNGSARAKNANWSTKRLRIFRSEHRMRFASGRVNLCDRFLPGGITGRDWRTT